MAFARGCWLLLHVVSRFGACATRFSSPATGSSTNALSWLPTACTGIALVLDTGDLRSFGFGLLAGIGLSVWVE